MAQRARLHVRRGSSAWFLSGWGNCLAGCTTERRCGCGGGIRIRADLPLILRQQLPKVSGLPTFFIPGIFLMGKLFLGIDPWAVRPEEDARRMCQDGIPLFIIHSTDDKTTPFEHAKWIKAACPEATVWRVEGYEHVGAYAHPEYRQRILGFLRTEVIAEET